ncbi:CCHC-type domain-containing protein [Aphis craccivora]|uniref:CCHC-type domain-containing protein n=1 Tax=Aphis craccivora TaxID=307492 RepID=A0A6G0VX08_APHCR|nr:CCHC-type domain-containing protein [Aphis craccivora]
MGHWTRDCRYKTNTTKPSTRASSSTAPKASVSTITCRYCRKPGHTKEECRKLKYVNLPTHQLKIQKTLHCREPTAGDRQAASKQPQSHSQKYFK